VTGVQTCALPSRIVYTVGTKSIFDVLS